MEKSDDTSKDPQIENIPSILLHKKIKSNSFFEEGIHSAITY